MKKHVDKIAASITFRDAPNMTEKEAREIGNWLLRQHHLLINKRGTLAKRYTARYLYIPGKE